MEPTRKTLRVSRDPGHHESTLGLKLNLQTICYTPISKAMSSHHNLAFRLQDYSCPSPQSCHDIVIWRFVCRITVMPDQSTVPNQIVAKSVHCHRSIIWQYTCKITVIPLHSHVMAS